MIITSFNTFIIKEEIEKNINYENWQIIFIFILYILIYFFGGIICFIPAQIFIYDETKNFWNSLLMLLTLTFAVITKNSFHFYFFDQIKSLQDSLVLCSFLFIFFSLIYLCFLRKFKTSIKKDNDNKINNFVKEKDLLYYDINQEEDSFEIKNEDFTPVSDYLLDENIYVEKDKNGNNNINMMERNYNKILNYTASFSKGYLNFKFERIKVGIKIKDKFEYFNSFFNKKFILLLLINFFSRFQKVKFKTDLKKLFDSMEHEYYSLILLNSIFVINYAITYFLLFIFIRAKVELNEYKKNIIYKQEKVIIYLIIITCTILLGFSYINMFLNNPNRYNICILAIAISGNINYLYYAFYSTKKRQFITMSGLFAISSVILKIIEIIYEPFTEMYWLKFQVISSIIGIFLSFIVKYIIEKEYKYLIMKVDYINEDSKKKKNVKRFLCIFIFLIILIIPIFFISISIEENKAKDNDIPILIDQFNYTSDSSSYKSMTYKLLGNAVYIICAYGPKAKKGGRGGKICGENYFIQNATLNVTFGGQQAGGKGGEGCGITFGKGYNGAGYTMVEYSNNFTIVAGGGGGNSESNNEGGDAESDGKGYFNGKGATKYKGGDGGDASIPKERGTRLKGGDGVGSSQLNKYCGGGGGAGYYGGGAGDWGEEKNAGGGGGGSNFCYSNKCTEDGINYKYDYSTIEIYKKKLNRNNILI